MKIFNNITPVEVVLIVVIVTIFAVPSMMAFNRYKSRNVEKASGAVRGIIVEKTAVDLTDQTEGQFRTIQVDGHRWMFFTSYRRCALVHHPDCPCGKR